MGPGFNAREYASYIERLSVQALDEQPGDYRAELALRAGLSSLGKHDLSDIQEVNDMLAYDAMHNPNLPSLSLTFVGNASCGPKHEPELSNAECDDLLNGISIKAQTSNGKHLYVSELLDLRSKRAQKVETGSQPPENIDLETASRVP